MQQAIGQGRLAMIDMRNNAEISYVFDVHRVQNSDTSGRFFTIWKIAQKCSPENILASALKERENRRPTAARTDLECGGLTPLSIRPLTNAECPPLNTRNTASPALPTREERLGASLQAIYGFRGGGHWQHPLSDGLITI